MSVGRPEIDPTWLDPAKETPINGSTPASSSPAPEPTPVQPPAAGPPVEPALSATVPVPPQPSVPPSPAAPPTPPQPEPSPSPLKPPASHLPRDERSQPLPAPRPRLARPGRWLIGGVMILVIVVGLFLASQAGWITLGVEHLWGLANRPGQAFLQAADGLAATPQYHVDAELNLSFTQPVRMPRLGANGFVPSAGSALLASDESGETFLAGRIRQDIADGKSLAQSEWQFAAPRILRAQMGPPFTHEMPLRIDALAAGDALYLRLPTESTAWTTTAVTELKTLSVVPVDWAALYRSLGKAVTRGKRIRGKTVNGEQAKGYQATVPASALAEVLVPGVAPSGEVQVESWIGTKTRRPYLLTVSGAMGSLEPNLTIVFGQFGAPLVIVPPASAEATAGTLLDWVVSHTLVAADTPASRDALRKADLARLKETLATYATEARPFAYPKTDGVVQLGQANEVTKALQVHQSPLPADPLAPNRYYGYTSDGTTYRLTAVLEQGDDPQGTKEGDLTLYVVTP